MRHIFLFRLSVYAVLMLVLMIGCGTTAPTAPLSATEPVYPTEEPAVPTEPHRAYAPPTASPSPAQPSPVPSPTPAPAVFHITTRMGTQVQLTSLGWQDSSYARDDLPTGIPIENGVEIATDYVRRFEIGEETDAGLPVTVTLLDGSILRSRFGWKATRFHVSIEGESPLGNFESDLVDIEAVEIERASDPGTVPPSPPSSSDGIVATLIYVNGEQLQVTSLGFRVLCWTTTWCCYGEDEAFYMPTVGGLDISFSKVREIEFLHAEKQGTRLPVNVTGLDSPVVTRWEIEPPDPCQEKNWRLTGNVALGRLDVEVTSIERIIFSAP